MASFLPDSASRKDQTIIISVDGVESALEDVAPAVHTHPSSEITDFNGAVDSRIDAQKGEPFGVAELDVSGKLEASQIPAITITEVNVIPTFPHTPSPEKGWVDIVQSGVGGNEETYMWDGSAWQLIEESNVKSVALKTGVVTLVPADVGLGNVDNVQQIPLTEKGANGGVAELDGGGLLPDARLSTNIPQLNGNQTFTGDNQFSEPVGIGGAPVGDALLDVSGPGALRVPRVSTATRNGLGAVDGMIVYNTDDNELNVHRAGIEWTRYLREGELGSNNGVAPLGPGGDLPLVHLPTHTHVAADITDFDTEVTNNAAVTANTAKVSADGPVTDHSDVTSPGSGAIITAAERLDLNSAVQSYSVPAGPGTGFVMSKVGTDLQFRGLSNLDNKVGFTIGPNTVDFTVQESFLSGGAITNLSGANIVSAVPKAQMQELLVDGAPDTDTTWTSDKINTEIGLAAGEVNTANNYGTLGLGVFEDKNLAELRFKKLSAGSTKLSITDGGVLESLVLDVVPGNIDHTTLTSIGTNSHADIDTHIANVANPHAVTKTQVGLGNVTNDAQIPLTQKGVANGVPALDVFAKVALSVIPTPKIWIFEDRRAAGTNGTAVSAINTFDTRVLNTNVYTGGTGVSLAANAITISADGVFKIHADGVCCRGDEHRLRIRQTAPSVSTIGLGHCAENSSADGGISSATAIVTRAGVNIVFQIQHACKLSDGLFGCAVNIDSEPEMYLRVEVEQLST
jgi:hypothetical protein